MNLFSQLPAPGGPESFETLIENQHVRIERIVSRGHASPEGFWYDQEQGEWVVVLRGEARLRFEDDAQPLFMKPGDAVYVAAHRRHRVDWTSDQEPTIWLAVHLTEEPVLPNAEPRGGDSTS